MEVLMSTASNKSAPEQQPLMISVTHHPSQHLEAPPAPVERQVLVDLLELPCLEAAPVQEHPREAQHQEALPAKDQQWTPSPKLMLPIRPLLPKMQKSELLLKTRMLPTLPQLQLTV